MLPVDAVVARSQRRRRVADFGGRGRLDDMILDIGPRTVEYVVSVLARARTLVWNGPFGAFEMEPFDNGTDEVAEAAAELTASGKLAQMAGGGDTMAALNLAGSPALHLCVDGGRRLPRMDGGQGAAGRRGSRDSHPDGRQWA